MEKKSKKTSASVQSQLPQQQLTPLSTLTMDELESVQGGNNWREWQRRWREFHWPKWLREKMI